MRENYYFSMEQPFSQNSQPTLQLQNQLTFPNDRYYFPNDVEIVRRNKSFKTILEIDKRQLSDKYTKRLSMINRSSYFVQLKQIKKEENSLQSQQRSIRLLLYYEPVPFSIKTAKSMHFGEQISSYRLQRILRQVFHDIVDCQLLYQVSIDNCGFT